MEIDHIEWLLVSDMELNLCIRMLGRRLWQDYPPAADDQGAEQQMLNAFLRLAHLGILESAQGRFRVSAHAKRVLEPVLASDRIWEISAAQSLLIRIYEVRTRCTAIRRTTAHGSQYGICSFAPEQLSEFLWDMLCGATDEALCSDGEENARRVEDLRLTCQDSAGCRSMALSGDGQTIWMQMDGKEREFDSEALLPYLRGEQTH